MIQSWYYTLIGSFNLKLYKIYFVSLNYFFSFGLIKIILYKYYNFNVYKYIWFLKTKYYIYFNTILL